MKGSPSTATLDVATTVNQPRDDVPETAISVWDNTSGAMGGDAGRDELLAAQEQALATARPFLPVRIKGLTVEVGPLTIPGRPGCALCAEARHGAVTGVAPMHSMLSREPARLPLPPHWKPVVGLLTTAVRSERPGVVFTLELTSGEVTRHHVTPVPDCPACSEIPEDSAQLARVALTSNPLPDPESLRTKPALPRAELAESLVDHRYGPVVHTYRDQIAPMAFVGVELATLAGRPRMDGYGRCPDYDDAYRVGYLETIERESSSWPGARRTVVEGSYRDLQRDALDPQRLGRPDPHYDDHPHSLLDPYSPDSRTMWVWAHSFETDEPVLIPEHVAYYGIPSSPGRARYLYECSNGAAVGGSFEEAILYGALELIERDSFLMAWYAQRPGTRLRLDGITDPITLGMLDTLTGEGCETRLFDITGETGLPTIWALALNPDNPDGATLSAAGAHPDPRKAIRAAIAEVAAMAVIRNRQGASTPKDRRRELLDDPANVRSLDDHVALYTLPEALPRLDWLLDSAESGDDLAEHFGDWRAQWVRPDLSDTLRLVVAKMRQAGMPPVAVRQTTARDVALGVEVAKVIAPGALAMTFGHVHHRAWDVPRLTTARASSGLTGPLQPHPFP